MQTVDAVWERLFSDPAHWVETKVTVGGVPHEIVSMKTEASVFPEDNPSVGGCCSREIDLEIARDPHWEIPRQAKIEPWVRLANRTEASSWIPKGKFYIDTREEDGDNLIIHGYCDLRRAEADCPIDGLDWPAVDLNVVKRIARQIGVELDPRTTAAINQGYPIQTPGDYSSREVLSGIAAMYGGSFLMSDEGKLLLVRMHKIPTDAGCLIDHNGDYITIGGVKILV